MSEQLGKSMFLAMLLCSLEAIHWLTRPAWATYLSMRPLTCQHRSFRPQWHGAASALLAPVMGLAGWGT